MYSEAYRKTVQNQVINEAINQRFMQSDRDEIVRSSPNSNQIHFHYAIMEIEAWLWGLKSVFQKIDQRFTKEYILEKTSFDIEAGDPETSFFHPSKKLEELFSSVGKSYNKSKGSVSSFESQIEKTDYQNLLDGSKCNSFNNFFHSVIT